MSPSLPAAHRTGVVLTVTPNPALDLTYGVDALTPGSVHRVASVDERAGGKGVNVARVLRSRGRSVRLVLPLGGTQGERVRADLERAGLRHRRVPIEHETRRTVTVVAGGAGGSTVLNEPGPELGAPEWAALEAEVSRALPGAAVAVLSGSLPPGAPVDGYARLVALAREAGVPSVLDTSGAALPPGLAAGPAVAKPNEEEVRAVLAAGDPSAPDPLDSARACLEAGAGTVVLSRGPAGLVAADGRRAWVARPARAVTGNATGAGDAVVAALAEGIARGDDLPVTLRRAIAWGAGAVASPFAGDVDPQVERDVAASAVVEEVRTWA